MAWIGAKPPVNHSSNIGTIDYDPETKKLAIEFKGGSGTYHFDSVTRDTYDRMLSAESAGKFFHASVKGKHSHTKV